MMMFLEAYYDSLVCILCDQAFLPEASFGLRVLSLPAYVCVYVCVCLCVCVSVNHELVRAIIHQPFKLGSPNLVQRSKTPWLRSLLFFGAIDLDPFWACASHYSPPILVRISKLGQVMHFSTVKIPVNSGLDWPWTSPSFLIPKLIFLHCGGVHWDCETVPGLFQSCSGTVSQSLHQCTWGTHSQSGIGPLVLECLIWIKQNCHLDSFTVWLFSQYDHVVPYTDLGGRGYLGV